MGYVSSIRIVVSEKGFVELKNFNDKYNKEHNSDFNLLDKDCLDVFSVVKMETDEGDEKQVYFGWDDVKWYVGDELFPYVTAIVRGLKHLEEAGFSYRMGRFGEDYDDIVFDAADSENEPYLEYPHIRREFDDAAFAVDELCEADYLLQDGSDTENDLAKRGVCCNDLRIPEN